MEGKPNILALEAETASEAAKGMSNMAWLRFNTFIKTIEEMKDIYTKGNKIYEADSDVWTSQFIKARHELETTFQEFNRVEYLKNVSKTATKKLKELESKKEKKIEEETKESRTRSDTDDLNQF